MMFFNNVQQVSVHAYHTHCTCPEPQRASTYSRASLHGLDNADQCANMLCRCAVERTHL